MPSSSKSTPNPRSSQLKPTHLKQLRLAPPDHAALVTPRASSLAPGAQPSARPPTQSRLDRATFTAQPSLRLLNTPTAASAKGKARALERDGGPSPSGPWPSSRSRAACADLHSQPATSRRLGIGAPGPGTSEHKREPTVLELSSSPPPVKAEADLNDWDRRHKRRVLGGAKAQLDLVHDPNFKGFGESPARHKLNPSSVSSSKRRRTLSLTTASQDSDSSPLGPRRDSPRAYSPPWGAGPSQDEPPEPSTFDPEEGYAPFTSAAVMNDYEDVLVVQAALVPGRGGKQLAPEGKVLAEDSDEDREQAEDGSDYGMEVPDSDDEDKYSLLGLGGADDSGFGEANGFNSSEVRKDYNLYDLNAHPTSILGNAFAATDDDLFAPTLRRSRPQIAALSSGEGASSSPHSLGRSESGLLMPPPPFPTAKRPRQPGQPQSSPRVLVANTQTQAAELARPPAPVISRAVVDQTQAPLLPKAAPFGAALADAWSGQAPAPPRQATVDEFFAAVTREAASSGDDEVVEDSQRVPSLGEQVAALAMLRDVREGRRRAEATRLGGMRRRARDEGEGDDEVEEVDEFECPSSQPRQDESGAGVSPLKTPTVDRIFKRPAGWPVSPSKRTRLADGEDADADEDEGASGESVETQWESYWTLASPSASLLAEYQNM